MIDSLNKMMRKKSRFRNYAALLGLHLILLMAWSPGTAAAPSSADTKYDHTAYEDVQSGEDNIQATYYLYAKHASIESCKTRFNANMGSQFWRQQVINAEKQIYYIEFGIDMHNHAMPAQCSYDPIISFPSNPKIGENTNSAQIITMQDGIRGVNFKNDQNEVLGLGLETDAACRNSGSDTITFVKDNTYQYFDIMAYLKPSGCSFNPGANDNIKTSFEVINFQGATLFEHPVTTNYECAVDYELRFKLDKVALLGTNVKTMEIESDSLKAPSVFGVYYALAAPLTSLDFNPPDEITVLRSPISNPESIDLPPLNKTPALSYPKPILTWTLASNDFSNLNFDGATTDVSFDDVNSPKKITLPDLTNVTPGMYTFQVDASSPSSASAINIESGWNFKLSIVDTCKESEGLTMTIVDPPSNMYDVVHDSTSINLDLNDYFSLSDANCSLKRFLCKQEETDQLCPAPTFDTITGLFSFSRDSVATRPVGVYTYIFTAFATDEEVNKIFNWEVEIVIPLTALSFTTTVESIQRFTDASGLTQPILTVQYTPSNAYPLPTLNYAIITSVTDFAITFDSLTSPTTINIPSLSSAVTAGQYDFVIEVQAFDTTIKASYTLEITVQVPCSQATTLTIDPSMPSTPIIYSYSGMIVPHVWTFIPQTTGCPMTITCIFPPASSRACNFFTAGTNTATLSFDMTDKSIDIPGSYSGTITATMVDNSSTTVDVSITVELHDPLTQLAFNPVLMADQERVAKDGQADIVLSQLILTPASPYPAATSQNWLLEPSPTQLRFLSALGAGDLTLDLGSQPAKLLMPDLTGVAENTYKFIVSVNNIDPVITTSIEVTIKVYDICSLFNNLEIQLTTKPKDVTHAPHNSTPYSWPNLANVFTTNIVGCPIISYCCKFIKDGKNCSDASSAGKATFDLTTGQFNFDYYSPTVRPVDSYEYEFKAFAGLNSDIEKTFTWKIVVSCAEVNKSTFAWMANIQTKIFHEVIRRDYIPGWTWVSPIVDPLNPSNNPLYNVDASCPVDWVVTLRLGQSFTNPVANSNTILKNEIGLSGQNNLAVQVAQPAANPDHWYAVIVTAVLPNYIGYDTDSEQYTSVEEIFKFHDGYALLQLAQYRQIATAIDLANGPIQMNWIPPIFKDDIDLSIELQNPTQVPARSIFFKVFGDESKSISSFINIEVNDNSLTSYVDLKFSKSLANIVESFDLIVCYNYGTYANLQDLCDNSVKHPITNALGTCYNEFRFTIDISKAAQLKEKNQAYELGADGFDIIELTEYAQLDASIVQNYGLGKDCGEIGYKLVNEAQGPLISISSTGKVSLIKTEDKSWLGQQSIAIQAYMKTLDMKHVHPYLFASLTLKLDISEPKLDTSGSASFVEDLIRQAPISLDPIAPRYYIDLNVTSKFIFNFADPLVIALSVANGDQNEGSLKPSGLDVRISKNELALVVSLTDLDFEKGAGYATVTLTCNGNEAFKLLIELMQKQLFASDGKGEDQNVSDAKKVPTIEGIITLAVRDKSSGGLTREFEIVFTIVYQESEESTTTVKVEDQKSTSQGIQERIGKDFAAKMKEQAMKQERIITTMINSGLQMKEQLRFKFKAADVQQPRVHIKKVTSTGDILLSFSNDMVIPKQDENRRLQMSEPVIKSDTESEPDVSFETVLQLKQMLEVRFIKDPIQDTDESINKDAQDLKGWKVSSYKEKNMMIKLDFADPQRVSQRGLDQVRVTFKNTTLIYDWFGQEVQNGTTIERIMPPQFESETEAKVFQAIEEAFSTYETGQFSQDVIINSIIAGSLQYFWSMVGAQQIIIMIPLFAIQMPANAQSIFGVLLQIAAFEMIPTDKVYEDMMTELEKLVEGEELDMLQQKMERLGFETIWLLPNLGSLLLFVGLYPIMVLVLLILHIVTVYCSKRCKSKRNSLRGQVFWNWTIKYLSDSYVVIVICCLYNLRYRSWDCPEASLNSNLAIATITALLCYPILMQLYLYRKRLMLTQKSFHKKFNQAYNGLDTKDGKYFLYPLFFYYRRLLVPMSIIFWPGVIFVQYSTMVITGVATIILLGIQHPFADRSHNRSEIVQECTIIMITYHVFCFTDWLPDLNVRHWLGYSVIACVLGQLFISLAVFAIQALRQRLASMKRQKLLKLAHKKAKADLEKRKKQNKKALRANKKRKIQASEESENDEAAFEIYVDSDSDIDHDEAVTPVNQIELIEPEYIIAASNREKADKPEKKYQAIQNQLQVIEEKDEEGLSYRMNEEEEVKIEDNLYLSDNFQPTIQLQMPRTNLDEVEEDKQVDASLRELSDLFPNDAKVRKEMLNDFDKLSRQQQSDSTGNYKQNFFYATAIKNTSVHPGPAKNEQVIEETEVRQRIRLRRNKKYEEQLGGYSGLFNY